MSQYPPPMPPGYLPYAQPYYQGPRRPGVVTGVAIVGIIFAALCLLCSPLAIIPYLTMPNLPAIHAIRANSATFEITMGLLFLRILLGGVLLVASIGALQLKPWARKTFLYYGFAGAFVYCCDIIATLSLIWPALAPVTKNQPNAAFHTGQLIGMTLPIFYCIWVLSVMASQRVIEAFAAAQIPTAPPWTPQPPNIGYPPPPPPPQWPPQPPISPT
jgi:hypothetical protein